jgi:hypothetical protein
MTDWCNIETRTVGPLNGLSTLAKLRALRRVLAEFARRQAAERARTVGKRPGMTDRHRQEMHDLAVTAMVQMRLSSDDALALAKNLADLQSVRCGWTEVPTWARLAAELERAGFARWSDMTKRERAFEEALIREHVRYHERKQMKVAILVGNLVRRAARAEQVDAALAREMANPKARA